MHQKSYTSNEVIFKQGTFGSTMYDIMSGRVGIFACYGEPDECQLAILGPGETFGEMGLVEVTPRSATAVALEDETVVKEIDTDEFAHILQDEPDKVLDIMRQLSARLRETNERYLQACHTVYDAIEAEKADKSHSGSVRMRLTEMLHYARRFGADS